MNGVDWADPGEAGFVVGGLLIWAGVKLFFRFTGRRAYAEAVAEVQPSYTTGRVRVPGVGRVEQPTAVMPRVADERDATVILPAYREMRRG